MTNGISQKTVQELSQFLGSFVQNKPGGGSEQIINLDYDTAKDHFYKNMRERGLAQETFRFYDERLRAFEKFLINIKKKNALHSVTTDEIKYYLHTKYSKHNPYTQNCNIRAIRAFFNYLERDGYIFNNPVTSLKIIRIPKQKIDYLSAEQIRKILTSFDLRKKCEIRNLLIVMLFIDTGVRVNELCNIKIENFSFAQRSIYIYATKTKTFRTVYYSPETERIINVYRREVLRSRENGYLFTAFHSYLDEPVDRQLPRERVQLMLRNKAKKLFGVDFRLNPHKFRHTFATHYIMNGGDPFSLKDLLGHTNLETTNIYIDLTHKDLKTKHDKHSIFANMDETAGGNNE